MKSACDKTDCPIEADQIVLGFFQVYNCMSNNEPQETSILVAKLLALQLTVLLRTYCKDYRSWQHVPQVICFGDSSVLKA